MKTKQKLILLGLFMMFLGLVGVFFYENFYEPKNEDEMLGKKYVVVATTNIAEGEAFKEGVNYGVIAMDEKFIFDDYIVYQKDKTSNELKTKTANSAILKNELVTTGRVSESEEQELYRLYVQPDNNFQVKVGDLVNVYVQLNEKDKEDNNLFYYYTFSLLDGVTVKAEVKKKDSKGNELPATEYLEVHVPEKDAINYHFAEYLEKNGSNILVLQHTDVLNDDKTVVPSFDGFQFAQKEFGNQSEEMKKIETILETTAVTKPVNETKPTDKK